MTDHRAIISTYFNDLVNGARHELAPDLLTGDFLFHGTDLAEPIGRDDFVARLKGNKSAFRESAYVLEETVAEGDLMAVRLRFEGVHNTGKPVAIDGLAMFRFESEKIAELWVVTDRAGMERQLA